MFSLKDLGQLHYFLAIEVSTSNDGGFFLSQAKYIRHLLHRAKMDDSKPLPTPMVSGLKLTSDASIAMSDPSFYTSIVGGLQYITITRPKLSYSINKVCQYMHQPQEHHWKALKRILRYLQGIIDYGLHFKRPTHLTLQAFSDSDWGSDLDARKSTTGFCVYLGGNLISWCSKKQKVVSRRSTKAEF
uniref:Reverse transcriptase Ty1/copia-type domain-containing protein n=1 Tax=Cajanus cajan TaxID=3821 RepID=A0A151QMH4_CAJCA|nr:hypothetical protein KK1_048166 [Cajanus cajan]